MMLPQMQCFHILVHGVLKWNAESNGPDDDREKPAGFYCHRYVLASTEEEAAARAFRRVRDNLDKQTAWLRQGLATLNLEAEEATVAPMSKLLKPDNRGHTFYGED
jgi:hypothetical protein